MDKIRKKEEYSEMYKNGQKYFGRYVILYLIKDTSQKNYLKTGFVASKKTGNAVVRNRIKRLLRTSLRNTEKNLKEKSKMVFIAKRKFGENIKEINQDKIDKDIFIILKKAKIL